jgi:hypothetical protein
MGPILVAEMIVAGRIDVDGMTGMTVDMTETEIEKD